ncbi:hypothetical protein BaRGS_00003544, partial [Batillaria attramentaria]
MQVFPDTQSIDRIASSQKCVKKRALSDEEQNAPLRRTLDFLSHCADPGGCS